MQILHVVPSYLPAVRYGGPIFAVHGLCQALAAMGHRVEVFTTNVDGLSNSEVPLNCPISIDGVQVNYFPSERLRRLYWSPALARALDTKISGFTVVHLHSVFLWPTWAAARVAKRRGVPYLISPRGMLFRELIKRRNRFIKTAWLRLVEKRNLENASAIHATSTLEAMELCHFGWRLPGIATIPNGVDWARSYDESELSADVNEIAVKRPYILFLGRISWKKGLDRLIEAVALLKRGELLIVGPDDEKLVPRLAQLARDLQIPERVRFLPRTVVGADKGHLYASAQVFVLPSQSENFGNTVLEAMQSGIPVITTPEVGAAQIVEHARAGLVVGGDPESLARGIQLLAEDVPLARSMGKAAIRHVRENYSWGRVAVQMEELYASIRARQPGWLVNSRAPASTANGP
jgi:glycosyltransferase involved in cell wall biosynthesis